MKREQSFPLTNHELAAEVAALRAAPTPAPPDDLALRHAWEAGFRLCRSYGDNHHHFDGEQKERRWLDYIKGLAAPAPVAAPAPEERSPYDSGLCCMARHASAKPPWSCDCPCHTAPAPETRVSYSCPHCGREYDRPAPAPETEEPLDEIDTSGYDYSGGGR